ncbi:MAG: ATP-dependent RecD-like DNA helicase [Armatimonadota bacterium]
MAREESPRLFEPEPAEVLEGVIERVTFHNEENGWSVLKIAPKDGGRSVDPVAVLGNFTSPTAGESVRCRGAWIVHPQHGRQFRAQSYEVLRPATAAAIERYLGSGLVKGIGPKTAKLLVRTFGDRTLDVIEQDPEKLSSVRGIGRSKAGLIRDAWESQRAVRDIMLFLQGHGVTPTFAVRIYKHYQDRAIEVVERNPYRLATDIHGIGFKSADRIAQAVGFAKDAPERLEAGVLHVLAAEMEGGGHCHLPRAVLVERAAGAEHLGVEAEGVERAVDRLVERGLLVVEAEDAPGEGPRVATAAVHRMEVELAAMLHRRLTAAHAPGLDAARADARLAGVPAAAHLSEEQRGAVRMALMAPLCILTGGPGTGKTTTTNAMVAAFEAEGLRVRIASPTGRAAKRASEVTGREARTIHRLLAWDPRAKAFKHGPDEPLELDVLVVDEASMLDLALAHALLGAVPEDAQVVLVGDVDQLPSVGPGNVLHDLIASGRVPVARLTQVFRQAARSRIVVGAHAIRLGEMPELAPPSALDDGVDFVFLPVEDAEEIPAKVAGIVAKSLPRRGFTPDMTTVLTPMQRGSAGARNLNERLQNVLNPEAPGKASVKRGERTLRVGDRVMQRVNDYDKGVFNGDVGVVGAIDTEEQELVVHYPEGPVEYAFADLDQLAHALATTVHKSQGSEYPAAVIVFHTQHYLMLQRNLLYTAVTRAKRLAVLVGSRRAVAMAVGNRNVAPRWTRLAERLRGAAGTPPRGKNTHA